MCLCMKFVCSETKIILFKNFIEIFCILFQVSARTILCGLVLKLKMFSFKIEPKLF